MRLFPLLLFVIAFGEVFGYYLAIVYKNNIWFYNLLNPIMHILYFSIMYYSINSRRFKQYILVSVVLYIIISTATYFLFCYNKNAFNEWMYILGIIILIISLISKLYELLEDPQRLDFFKKPFFYILIFTLLFYTVTIPNFAMDNWMASTKMNSLTAIINNVSNVFNILLYTVYTLSFLWIKKTGIY